jgi:hypothetical protein
LSVDWGFIEAEGSTAIGIAVTPAFVIRWLGGVEEG